MMDSDQLLDELIFRKVKGEPSPFDPFVDGG